MQHTTEGDHVKIWHSLTPLSWIYGGVVGLRNMLFECGALRSESFDIPVISVGNITVGGTGKTPHTEYLIRLLSQKHQVAILSRGYKRKTKGYHLATNDTPMRDIGDEPYQMKHKYPFVHMAVDKNRRRGIRRLCDDDVQPPADVILLDDAFQHRYVQPGVNILLMDYHRLIYFDRLLPAGRLRESRSSSQRADIVIVTKCPDYITPMEQHGIARSLEMQPWQQLYYTRFGYGNLKSLASILTGSFSSTEDLSPALPLGGFCPPINGGTEGGVKTIERGDCPSAAPAEGSAASPDIIPLDDLKTSPYNVLLLTGIASPQQMEYDLSKYCQFESLHFADHHNFTHKNLVQVDKKVKELETTGKTTIVVTTEKDATRLLSYAQEHPDDDCLLCRNRGAGFYVLPIEVEFMNNQAEQFNQYILSYVQKNSRNSTLSRRTHISKT